MRVGLHDADKCNFPNLALMKLSAHHKKIGDKVEWFHPAFGKYDIVYSSKVFTWTIENKYLPKHTIKGGTGYGIFKPLQDNIEHIFPDYSLYQKCNHSIGFLTRGCIRNCPWCIVPKKEGILRKNAHFEEFTRSDTRNIVFMDNNPLACSHGIDEITRLSKTKLKVDFNQGLDARIIASDKDIAKRLSALKWFKPLRLACDQKKSNVIC